MLKIKKQPLLILVILTIIDLVRIGGHLFPLTVQKHLRVQAIAQDNNLSCRYLCVLGGENLPSQDYVFRYKEHVGRIYVNKVNMLGSIIPE